MATGSTQYSYVNKLRAGGGAPSAASRRSPQRGGGTQYQATNPNAPNYVPF